jgi:hypothetical protein
MGKSHHKRPGPRTNTNTYSDLRKPSFSAMIDFPTSEPPTRLATIGNTEYDYLAEPSISNVSLSNMNVNAITPVGRTTVVRPYR